MINHIMSERFWFMEPAFLETFLKMIKINDALGYTNEKAVAIFDKKNTAAFKPYKIKNGIATITIEGPLLKRVPPILAFLFGIQSMESIGNAFNAAWMTKM